MTKLLSNKAFKAFVALAMAVLLVVTLVPTIQPAYGDNSQAAAEVAEAAADTTFDEGASDEASPDDAENGETEGEDAPASDEPSGDSDVPTEGDGDETDEPAVLSDDIETYAINGNKTNTNNLVVAAGETSTANLTYDGPSGTAYTLTVNGTLNGRIHVKGGAVLTIQGSGTIQAPSGAKAGSIIRVEGGNSKLVFDGPTVTGATNGTLINKHAVFVNDSTFKAGGGILVERGTDGSPASLHFKKGTVKNNSAQVGGGIFIDRECGFTMGTSNGTSGSVVVKGNTATKHEGGGIYLAGHKDADMDDKARLNCGTIKNNKTQTTTDWGGGGIFIESEGHLKVASTLITGNTAQGLGGGISGCPHATIGIGEISEGVAIYSNTAAKATYPDNDALYHNSNGVGDYIAYENDSAGFTADKAMDFYCTKGSVVFGQDSFATNSGIAWTGRKANASGGSDVTIKRGQYLKVSGASLGLTATEPTSAVTGRKVEITGNTSTTHGGGIGCNGSLTVGSLPTGEQWGEFSLSLNKKLVNTLGENLSLGDRTFSFDLHTDKSAAAIGTAQNDSQGNVTFTLGKQYYQTIGNNREQTLTFYVRETGTYEGIESDNGWHTVNVRVKKLVDSSVVDSISFTTYFPEVQWVKLDGNDVTDEAPGTITNTLVLEGSWSPEASKVYFGDTSTAAGRFSFQLDEVEAPGSALPVTLLENGISQVKANGAFTESDGSAKVAFDAIKYAEPGTHWYRIQEQGAADPRVYLVKVEVAGNKPGASTALEARVTEVRYADNGEDGSALHTLDASFVPTFYNTDESLSAIGFASYSVYAASGEPVEQKCLVDPKMWKKLEGRALRAGEFKFHLVQAAIDENGVWKPTGTVISTALNDEFGMVDFDKANPVAGTEDDPCCLLFTAPGKYGYMVIEDEQWNSDPSVDYGDEIITFYVEVEQKGGSLEATAMYYGYLNEAGQNVAYTEADDDTFSTDASWHPTMVNHAKPMDLAVRKTSVTDREEGLKDAVYGLYLVSDAGQSDVYLGNASSDDEGWLYFEDVNLGAGNLYYFLEEEAPDGHTVSRFRSKYFYLAADGEAAGGYVLKYTDNRYELEGEGDGGVATHDGELDETFGGNAAAAAAPTYGKDGALLYVYTADGGVYDEATSVAFNKLDARTHEWVEGAKLSIVEKDTGRVVNSWVSGKSSEVLQKALNVDTVYILREDEAPAGYQVADPVEFRIDAYGVVEVLSGTSNGNAELSGDTITLYDTRIPLEEVVTEVRENVREVPSNRLLQLAQTGDTLPLLGLGLVVLSALVVLVLAARRNRKRSMDR